MFDFTVKLSYSILGLRDIMQGDFGVVGFKGDIIESIFPNSIRFDLVLEVAVFLKG
jgi:hypothetical protein